MVEVIKIAELEKYETVCRNCESTLSFNKLDLFYNLGTREITCPVCKRNTTPDRDAFGELIKLQKELIKDYE